MVHGHGLQVSGFTHVCEWYTVCGVRTQARALPTAGPASHGTAWAQPAGECLDTHVFMVCAPATLWPASDSTTRARFASVCVPACVCVCARARVHGHGNSAAQV